MNWYCALYSRNLFRLSILEFFRKCTIADYFKSNWERRVFSAPNFNLEWILFYVLILTLIRSKK